MFPVSAILAPVSLILSVLTVTDNALTQCNSCQLTKWHAVWIGYCCISNIVQLFSTKTYQLKVGVCLKKKKKYIPSMGLATMWPRRSFQVTNWSLNSLGKGHAYLLWNKKIVPLGHKLLRNSDCIVYNMFFNIESTECPPCVEIIGV